MHTALTLLKAVRDQRHPIVVHCSAGNDRTGLVMSHFLIREFGLDVETAIARVREVRPRAMTARGWESLSRRVLARLRESWRCGPHRASCD